MITIFLIAAILYGIAITWLYVIAKLDCQKMEEEYNYRLEQQKEQDNKHLPIKPETVRYITSAIQKAPFYRHSETTDMSVRNAFTYLAAYWRINGVKDEKDK